jgi:hypothetical protein
MTTPVLTFAILSRIILAAATAVDQTVRTCKCASARSRSYRSYVIAACFAFGVGFAPLGVHAADYTPLYKAPPMAPAPDQNAGQDFIATWLAMVTATQAAQPKWLAPVATVTPLLMQQYRFDTYFQHQGNGSHIDNYGGGRGLEIIPAYNTEVILGVPPYDELTTAAGKTTSGWGDWPTLLLKTRILSANEQQGNYILTAFVQMSAPTGFPAITNNVYVVQPTIAFGKGWGDFDVQATVSQQYAVEAIGPPGALGNFGNPFLANLTLQYHLLQYFWPEFEFNYTYWPGGTHRDLSQLLLTPGLIIGRIPFGGRNNLVFGAGYQFAVTDNPVTRDNWVVTARMTF